MHDISMLDLYISPFLSHTRQHCRFDERHWCLRGRYPFHTTTQSIPPRKRGDERGKDGWRRGKGRVGEGDDSSSVRGAVHQCLNPQTCIYSHPTILTNEPWIEGKKGKWKDGRAQGKYATELWGLLMYFNNHGFWRIKLFKLIYLT